jgi:hypothetical protein
MYPFIIMVFVYHNTEKHGGHVRRVVIRGGSGFKSVTHKRRTLRMPLTRTEIKQIKKRKFIPGLFATQKWRKKLN